MKIDGIIALLEKLTHKKVTLYEYIKTADINKVIQSLSMSLSSKNGEQMVWAAQGVPNENSTIMMIITYDNINKINLLLKKAELLGWFPSAIQFNYGGDYTKFDKKTLNALIDILKEEKDDDYDIIIVLEKNYDEEFKKSQFIYHATPYEHLEKIKKIGLIPKHKDKQSTTPERIYFATSYDAAKGIAYQLSNFEANNQTGKYAIISIDTHRLPTNIKFYNDPNYRGGIYTYQNISKEYIKKIHVIHV